MAGEIGQRKLRRLQRVDEPGVDLGRQRLQLRGRSRMRPGLGGRGKRLSSKRNGAFLQFNAMVGRQVFEFLSEAAGPGDSSTYAVSRGAETKEEFFGVLSQEAGTRLQVLGLAKAAGLDGDRGSDGIAIAAMTAQAKGDGLTNLAHDVMQNSQLGRVSVLKYDLQPSVAIEISEGKGATVINDVQSGDGGDFRERAIAVVREHDVSRVAVPGVIAADEFVDGIPAKFVGLRRGRVFGRFLDLPPPSPP